jgi:hypothetical protein
MSRIACALSLIGCMVWLASTYAIEPDGQEKVIVQEAPAKAAVKIMAVPVQPAKMAVKEKAAAVRQVAPPMAIFAQQGGDANFLMPQFVRIQKTELHFMRMVCQPSRQQFEKIAADSLPALKAAAQKFAGANPNAMGGVMIVQAGIGRNNEDQSDPQKLVAEVVAKSVRKVLSAEQANRYDKELAERMEDSKHGDVLASVVKMDKLLQLTADQRDEFVKLLDAKWKYSANRLQLLNMGDQWFPAMPNEEINQVLSELQKQVWSGLQNRNVNFAFGVAMDNQQQPDIEEVWDEPAQKSAPKGAEPADKANGTKNKERP